MIGRTAILLVMLVIPVALGETPGFTAQDTVEIVHEQWVALRFNVTRDSDLHIALEWVGCDPDGFTSLRGVGWGRLSDGKPVLNHLMLGSHDWGVGSDFADASVSGVHAQTPSMATAQSCLYSYEGYNAGTPLNQSITIFVLSGAPRASLTYTATWTRGVTSHDVAVGQGLMRTRSQFDEGVAASYYTFPEGAGLAIASRQSIEPVDDFVGWFAPERGIGASAPLCTHDGAACPAPSSTFHTLASQGPSTWEVGFDYLAQVGSNPYYALGAISFPDDSYVG